MNKPDSMYSALRSIGRLSIIVGSLIASKPSYAEEPYVLCYRLGDWINCVAAPLASEENDKAAKAFSAPAEGKGALYLVRRYTDEPKKRAEVFLDGKRLSQLVPKTYLLVQMDPGRHKLTVGTDHDVELELQVTAGSTYFVEYRPGRMDRLIKKELFLTNQEAGRTSVLKTQLLQMEGFQ